MGHLTSTEHILKYIQHISRKFSDLHLKNLLL